MASCDRLEPVLAGSASGTRQCVAKIHIGTSGWHYDHWKGPFYPEGMKAEEFLSFYASRFGAAEINNTFYQLPELETLADWCSEAPHGFVFASKASRYIMHMKKLKDPVESTKRFFDAVEALGKKLGPILFQLPPGWRVDADRLEAFLESLPSGHKCVFEFRDPSWFRTEVCDALANYGAAFCIYHIAGRRSPIEVTGSLAYVRLHGPGDAYEGSYDGRTLFGWARRLLRWRDEGRDVYCFFDNDEKGYAALDGMRLQQMMAAR